ncbi:MULTISPECIES: GntR family transcriptional regulator [Pseudonocardia]|uniref:HTH-type transcriptional repressor YvoA n=2 Tax=Pseudonocardia TaxID=1847 RepID=A0A1Y2N163_PSEAH|nr:MULTISPECIES: GntR family transcriptional regulator [Pseudonocardia]OSY41180.1 HTH-type transcriptional repressor YvoA [Pseudonocardia autotrophica]TDN76636.1 GntR family transcriptional regulator [Pseudonocardia autotrophica]BBG00636.1 GntR family transcriptional regulator [Pseudonocardia autotrophica]GEC28010.1 GntR family transcriptional regulator [Pseudonocardia saturnea]
MTRAVRIGDGVVPKHEQLRTLLTDAIARDFAPGDPFPSERRLCLDHGVSRVTVRAAVGQLERDGLLTRVRGKGTYVAARTARSRLHLASFHDDMRRLGLTPTTVVLEVTHTPPSPEAAKALGLGPDQRCYRVRRLRVADGVPMSIDDAWYDAELAPGLDRHDLSHSIYAILLEHYELPIDRAEQSVAARQADEASAVLLGIAPREPILVFDRTASSGGRVVEYSVSRYRGDRYELHMSLDREWT